LYALEYFCWRAATPSLGSRWLESSGVWTTNCLQQDGARLDMLLALVPGIRHVSCGSTGCAGHDDPHVCCGTSPLFATSEFATIALLYSLGRFCHGHCATSGQRGARPHPQWRDRKSRVLIVCVCARCVLEQQQHPHALRILSTQRSGAVRPARAVSQRSSWPL